MENEREREKFRFFFWRDAQEGDTIGGGGKEGTILHPKARETSDFVITSFNWNSFFHGGYEFERKRFIYRFVIYIVVIVEGTIRTKERELRDLD